MASRCCRSHSSWFLPEPVPACAAGIPAAFWHCAAAANLPRAIAAARCAAIAQRRQWPWASSVLATTGVHWCLMRHCPSKKYFHAVDLHRAQRPDVAEGASPLAYVPPLALTQPKSAGPSQGGRWASTSRVGSNGGCVLHYKGLWYLVHVHDIVQPKQIQSHIQTNRPHICLTKQVFTQLSPLYLSFITPSEDVGNVGSNRFAARFFFASVFRRRCLTASGGTASDLRMSARADSRVSSA